MASTMSTLLLVALGIFFCAQAVLGVITCENLEKDKCAFAVSSTGQRCVLEKGLKRSREEAFHCRASSVYADQDLKDWVETTHCLQSCGLDRYSLGISSDSLIHKRFTQLLCSPPCMDACPNIVDLYLNLAASEGVSLPQLCAAQKGGLRRRPGDFLSASMAEGPVAGAGTLSETLDGEDGDGEEAPALPPFQE